MQVYLLLLLSVFSLLPTFYCLSGEALKKKVAEEDASFKSRFANIREKGDASFSSADTNWQVSTGSDGKLMTVKPHTGEPDKSLHSADFSARMWREWALAISWKFAKNLLNVSVPFTFQNSAFNKGIIEGYKKVPDNKRSFGLTSSVLATVSKELLPIFSAGSRIRARKNQLRKQGKSEEELDLLLANVKDHQEDMQLIGKMSQYSEDVINYAVAASWAQQFPEDWKLDEDTFTKAMPVILGYLSSGNTTTISPDYLIPEKNFHAINWHISNGMKFDRKKKQQKEISDMFMNDNAKEKGVKVHSSGLQYKIMKKANNEKKELNDEGTFLPEEIAGKEESKIVHFRALKPSSDDDYVKFHCVANRHRGIETIFDTTTGKNLPLLKRMKDIFHGLRTGLSLMEIGDNFTLYIPYSLGYGDSFALGTKIYPFDTLIYNVKLLEVFRKASAPIPATTKE